MPPFLMGPTHNVLLAHSPNTPHKALSGDSRNFLGLSPENKNFDFSKGFLTNKMDDDGGDRILEFPTSFENAFVLNDYDKCNGIIDKIQELVEQRRNIAHAGAQESNHAVLPIQGREELNASDVAHAGAQEYDSNRAANIQGREELNAHGDESHVPLARAQESDSNRAANIQGGEDDFQQAIQSLANFIKAYNKSSCDECDNILQHLREIVAKRVNGKPFVYGQELENLLDLDSLDQHIPRSPMFNEHAFGFGINDVGDIDADGEEAKRRLFSFVL
ncbi:hypothetical protein F2Q69_00001971 [Brassica cretica]|uniref:Uncharacterized protein n=1 Tax=Brassica cretica TaxID=69181 RepID=A0A8S9PFV6_BRACR|nr:hypothetical protein F2Q69_00001971 [Brassica cretica]